MPERKHVVWCRCNIADGDFLLAIESPKFSVQNKLVSWLTLQRNTQENIRLPLELVKLSSQSEFQRRVDPGDAASTAAWKYDANTRQIEVQQLMKNVKVVSTYSPTILKQVAVVHAVKDAMQRPPVLVVGDPSTVVALPSGVVQGLERDSDLGSASGPAGWAC